MGEAALIDPDMEKWVDVAQGLRDSMRAFLDAVAAGAEWKVPAGYTEEEFLEVVGSQVEGLTKSLKGFGRQ